MSGFRHVNLPWVIALASDEVQLLTWRSEVVSKSDPLWEPVRVYIEQLGLALVEEELLESDKHIYGRTWKQWWAVPSARNLLMQFPAEESADD